LIMRELEGCTYDEIALSLGIPLNTVRTRILRARRALFEAAGKEARP
jgi:RNA polymerase sigma-70 factor, ECF subfamily